MIGNRSLAFFPDKGEEKVIGPQYIQPTQEKEPVKAKIIYIDFETYVQGKHIETGEIEPTVHIDELPLPSVVPYNMNHILLWRDSLIQISIVIHKWLIIVKLNMKMGVFLLFLPLKILWLGWVYLFTPMLISMS